MKAVDNNEQHFHESADTFRLSASLRREKLTVTLKDFVDWVIYEKQFGRESIGEEIHPKMDLIDVYSGLAQSRVSCDQSEIELKETGDCQLREYVFGTVISVQGTPCYKISQGGKIDVYLIVIDKRTKKQITYESKLELVKVRNLTEAEILQEKQRRDQSLICGSLKKEISRLKKINDESLLKTMKQEETINRMTEEAKASKQKINQLQKQLIQKNEQLKIAKEESAKRVEELKKVEESILNFKISERFQAFPQFYRNYFKLSGLKVQYTWSNSGFSFLGRGWTHFIFDNPINHNQSTKFKLKILQTSNRLIMIGVVDYQRQRDMRFSFESGNAMCYYAFNGNKYPELKQEGDGYNRGDVVEVHVNRVEGSVKYVVNGVLNAQHRNKMLEESSRIFMPFVQMIDVFDQVEWQMD